MDELPYELLCEIIVKLSLEEIINFSLTCREYYKIINDWNIWAKKAQLEIKYPKKDFYNNEYAPINRYLYVTQLTGDVYNNLLKAIKKCDLYCVSYLLHHIIKSTDTNIHLNRRTLIYFSCNYDPSKLNHRQKIIRLVIVRILLLYEQFDPNVGGYDYQNNKMNDSPMEVCCENNNLPLLEILIKTDRISTTNYNLSLIKAAKHGHLSIIERFLSIADYNPFIFHKMAEYSLVESCTNNRFDVVGRLLLDDRFYVGLRNDFNKSYGYVDSLLLKLLDSVSNVDTPHTYIKKHMFELIKKYLNEENPKVSSHFIHEIRYRYI